jgi:hypothetical protein
MRKGGEDGRHRLRDSRAGVMLIQRRNQQGIVTVSVMIMMMLLATTKATGKAVMVEG